ncbi:hypothetical protein [Methylopila turkensis]|uniref:Uncharacterized protein n=1 Tax=Methylopila turkensis TaxID=1437816 RepID=A0A9W6N5D2_9HYPH|nr:hypothetical protein [Methylopila turkensis]GLK79089.1 hypothetical protein GCM10008174_08300 [Methylopila turkensis]
MDASLRVVTSIPLDELWDEVGAFGRRVAYLSVEEIKTRLRVSPMLFVEANVGDRLRWTSPDQCYERWKQISLHIADPNSVFLEHFSGGWAFVASEWEGRLAEQMIVFEMHH